MQVVGPAVLLHKGGIIDLVHSTFRTNFAYYDSTDGIGIENFRGEVHCDPTDCFPVCTTCLWSPPPSLQPTVQQGVLGSPLPKVSKRSFPLPTTIGLSIGLGFIFTAMLLVWRRWLNSNRRDRRRFERLLAGELATLVRPLDPLDAANNMEPNLVKSVELVTPSVMMTYEYSPAPVFVVDCNSVRIKLWSPGMKIAAPMVGDPVGRHVLDLPFVNISDGAKVYQFFGKICDAPGEHDATRTFMLHLFAPDQQHVLLEMTATHMYALESEPIIVCVGRQVESHLAGLMADRAMAFSESNHDDMNEDDGVVLRSVSQAGSVKGDDETIPVWAKSKDLKCDANLKYDANLNDEFDESEERFHLRSVSEVGSSKGDDADADGDDKRAVYRQLLSDDLYRQVVNASIISSLTSPTFSIRSNVKSQSTISSLTTPMLDTRTHSKVKTRHRSDMEPSPAVLDLENGARNARIGARETVSREVRGSGSVAFSVVLGPTDNNTTLSLDNESSLGRYIASCSGNGRSNDSGPDVVSFGRSSSNHVLDCPPPPPPSVS